MIKDVAELYTMVSKMDLTQEREELVTDRLLAGDFSERMALVWQNMESPEQTGKVGYTDRGGNYHGYKYTKLNELLKTLKRATKDTGIVPMTNVKTIDRGKDGTTVEVSAYATTPLGYRKSGPMLTSNCASKPQEVGSTITYLRRYSLGAFFGIETDTDDDAGSANSHTSSQDSHRGQTNQNAGKYAGRQKNASQGTTGSNNKASARQVNYLKQLATANAQKAGIDPETALRKIASGLGVERIEDASAESVSKRIDKINKSEA